MNFIQVLHGINFFKKSKFLKKQYDFLPKVTRDELEHYLDSTVKKTYSNYIYKTHKEIIKNINESN